MDTKKSSKKMIRRTKQSETVLSMNNDDKKVVDLFRKYQRRHLKENNVVQLLFLYQELLSRGIDMFQDERTAESIKTLPPYSCFLNMDHICLTISDFQKFMNGARDFLLRCFEDKLVIANFNFLRAIMEFIQATCKEQIGDKISSEIPHLSKQNPDSWAISICSTDGQICYYGDYNTAFTIQDACKPFLYALALELFGEKKVQSYAGFQISKLPHFFKILHKNKALNPAMESGAILLCSLIINEGLKDMTEACKFDYILNFFKKFSGRRHIGYNKSIFLSLKNNSHPYLSIAYFMESRKCFQWAHNVEEDLEFYLQIRSLEVNCESLSMIGATLANIGVNPFTKETVISKLTCRKVLSFMQLLSGGPASAYLIEVVCLPVIFSITGLSLLVLPHQLSFSFFSPKLQAQNMISSKSLQFIKELEREFNLHPYDSRMGMTNVLDVGPYRCKYNCQLKNEACRGDAINLASHLQFSKEVHFKDYMGKTLLHCAAIQGHIECVKYILSVCPKLAHEVDNTGNSAKENAEFFGHRDVAEFLNKYE